MAKYAALLRGINVGGIRIKMAELTKLFEELGFDAVETVLASGNVVFESKKRAPALKKTIEAALSERFDYEAWILLRSLDEIQGVVDAFPFDEADSKRQPYVVFCEETKVQSELMKLAPSLNTKMESVEIGKGVIYWHVKSGESVKRTFGKALGQRRYKSTTTTRNMRTLRKILACGE
jgi:uncharacterized protein (DUF1697 family)